MASGRYERVWELFNAAVELRGEQRPEFLQRACGDDPDLRREVESLLAHDQPGTGLDQPALGAAINVARLASAPEAKDTLPLPERIGTFEILGLLGSGGMGVVYRAQQSTPAREIALKLIRPGLATSAARRRFQMESRTLARLRHPGIATIYEAGTLATPAGEQPYIVMEYVRGLPLREFAEARAMDTPARVALLARLCDAIEHAHQRGVIHRDLKPGNILVEEIDGLPQPRILDFGVARLTDGPTQTTTATASGQLIGTLAYMSPEQLDADPHAADTRSDIYSLGAIGYELLSGQLPVDVHASSVFAAMEAVRDTSPRSLASLDRSLRGDLDTIILKALDKDPEQRYASAAALAVDLRRHLAKLPILGRKPSLRYLASKFAARHRVLVAATAVALLGLVSGVVGISIGLVRARQAGDELRGQVQQTSETAAFLARDVVAHLDAIAGTAEVRQRLLDRLDRQVTDLLQRSPDDAVLLDTHAAILTQRSDIAVDEDRLDDALDPRREALTIRERLAAAEPNNPERQADLSIALVKLGDLFNRHPDVTPAQALYDQAFAIDVRLAQDYPASRHFVDNLAWSYDRLGHLAMRQADHARAEALFERRCQTNLRLLKLDPGNLTTVHGIWEVQSLLASLAEARADDSAAREHLRAALEAAHTLVQGAPHNRLYRQAEVVAHLQLAHALGDDPTASAELYDEAAGSARRLLELDPHDAALQRLLWTGLVDGAQMAARTANTRRSIELLTEALNLYHAGILPDPTPPDSASGVANLETLLYELRSKADPSTSTAAAVAPATAPAE